MGPAPALVIKTINEFDCVSPQAGRFYFRYLLIETVPRLYNSNTARRSIPCTAQLSKNKPMSYRIGFGVDFHQLTEERDLWIGGIKISHYKGAIGHSDADVLLHAICDAL